MFRFICMLVLARFVEWLLGEPKAHDNYVEYWAPPKSHEQGHMLGLGHGAPSTYISYLRADPIPRDKVRLGSDLTVSGDVKLAKGNFVLADTFDSSYGWSTEAPPKPTGWLRYFRRGR